jgi:hypothetical protein
MEMRRPTIDAMPTKRSLEYISSERIQPEARACKRARTEKFLEDSEEFNLVQQTCRFFDGELSTVGPIENSYNKTDDSSSLDGFEALVTNVRKQTAQHEERFRLQCEILKADADEAIRLHQSFHFVAAALESSGNNEECHLPLLNQGPETNSIIKGMIADFAGVESESDIADWKELRTLLQ